MLTYVEYSVEGVWRKCPVGVKSRESKEREIARLKGELNLLRAAHNEALKALGRKCTKREIEDMDDIIAGKDPSHAFKAIDAAKAGTGGNIPGR